MVPTVTAAPRPLSLGAKAARCCARRPGANSEQRLSHKGSQVQCLGAKAAKCCARKQQQKRSISAISGQGDGSVSALQSSSMYS
eukprot:scaffold92284_cov19-Tisochrysis_lutea.AAC.1